MFLTISSKFIIPKPLKWGMLGLCTLIFQYDNHKNALKNQYNWDYYPDYFLSFVAQILISYCKFSMPKALKWGVLRLCTLTFQYDILFIKCFEESILSSRLENYYL